MASQSQSETEYPTMAGNLPNGITATKGKRGTTYRVRWQVT